MTPYWHYKRRKRHGLTTVAEVLLDLCRRWPEPGCTRADLMKVATQEKVASPMTLHKAVNLLIEKKMVSLNDCKFDKRAKRLLVTEKGKNFLGDYREYKDE